MTITCSLRTKTDFKKIALSFPECVPLTKHSLLGYSIPMKLTDLPIGETFYIESESRSRSWYAMVVHCKSGRFAVV